jgi:plasmid segregation protein ParM
LALMTEGALRREAASIDLVLLAGGGGNLYGDGLRDLFAGAVVIAPHTPVAANARVFFRHAH